MKKYILSGFDLCDSTHMKRETPFWPWIVFMFYNRVEVLRTEVIQHHPSRTIEFQIWKSVGDEILLYREILDDRDIEKALHSILMMKHFLDGAIDSCLCCVESLARTNGQWTYQKRTKASIWTVDATTSAPTSTFDFKQMSEGNIVCSIDGRLDFVGPDVDFGFRISSKAESNKVTVSADVFETFVEMQQNGNCIEPTDRYRPGKLEHVSLKGVTEDCTLHYLYEDVPNNRLQSDT